MKRIFPMNRVEGDLKITLETDKGVVSEAWSSGTMYRGFENIMLGRGSLDGLVITPRICGICSTSHLYAAVKALDMICQTDVPDNAVRVRNICLMTEMLQNDVRQAALLFMPDFCNSRYADSPLYEEAFRRYAPLKGQMAIETIRESKRLLEIIAILGGQWPHSSFMVPGGVVCVPGATDISNCRYLLNTFRRWYEKRFLGCGIERWSEIRSMADLNVWLEESESHRNSEIGFFIRFSKEAGLDNIGRGCGHFISFGALDMPGHTEIKSLNGGKTLLPAGFDLTPFHQRNITEDISHSWFGGPLEPKHPFEGVTKPYATGSEDKRYSWAKAPRYEGLPAETGPLADMIIAGHPLLLNLAEISGGVSVFTRQLARMIRPALLIPFADIWLKEISASKESFFTDYEMPESGDGFGLTQAPRGALGHWVKIRDSQIEKYQIITPTAWNASPRDSNGFRGPWEESLIGVEIRDDDNPIEAQHIIRSFDPCLVCTVHAINPSPAPPRNGEGSLLFAPPSLSGKGAGGLGDMAKPLFSDRFVELSAAKIQSLIEENRVLRQEIRVAREAAEITASLVVKQFEETEKILERFQKANALRQAVLNSAAQIAIIAADRENCITIFNTGAENLLGYKAHELIAVQTPEIFLSETELINRSRELSASLERKIEIPDLLTEYALLGRVEQQEWTYIRKDGSPFPVMMSINALRDADGVVNGFLCFATDISEKKRTEKAFQESEKKFRLLIRHLPNIVVRGYVDGYLDVFDDKIEMLTGYSRKDFTFRKVRWWDIILPEDRANAKEIFWKAFQREDKSYIRQYRIRAKNAKIIWIEESAQIVCNETGDIEYMSGAFLDITERKQAEEALYESEKKFRMLISNLPNVVARGYADGSLDVFDDKIEALTGYSKEEFLSRKVRWRDIVIPEDHQKSRDIFREAFHSEDKSFTRQVRIHTKDGRIIWIEERSQIICNEKGDLEYISGAFLDISERKIAEEALKKAHEELEQRVAQRTAELAMINEELQNEIRERKSAEDALKNSEEKYRGIFENATEGIFQTTPDGRIVTANTAFAKNMGYDSAEEVIRTVTNLRDQVYVYPEKRDEFKALLKERGVIRDFETQYYRKDGSVIHISMNARTVCDPFGNILYYEGMLKNITQRKRAEQLKIEKDAAEAAALTKSEFLANMSHEIRTPLNAVIGLTDLVMRTKLDPKQIDYLEKIHLSSHSLLKIINDILDFSKIEAGKLHLEDTDFQLRDLLDNILDMLSGRASERGIELIISIADDMPCALKGDPLRLGQVLINLIANAIKFTKEGEVIVRVSLIKKEADRVRLRFSVKDSGIGISRQHLSKLFSAFTQADSSTTRKYGGTGLGLVISQRLAEMMGGEIRAESEPGMGSTFFFTAELGLQPDDNEIKPQIPDVLKHLRVMVVDDNASSRQILQEYLESFNFRTTSVESGQAALEELNISYEHKPYDLVIIDWMMPEMDGIATIRKKKDDSRLANIPVILMTAFGREEVMKQAESAGVNAFLLKPIKQSVLLDTIMDVFGHETIISAAKNRIALSKPMNKDLFDGVKVLLAEDNAINQQVATEILSAAGIIVETADNGQEAIRAIFGKPLTDGYPYDIVLMDVQMPEMDGYDATRLIRSDPAYENLPIIAMTAHAMKGDKERCLSAGMNDYVTKPIDTEKLFEALARWIKKEVRSEKCKVKSEKKNFSFLTSQSSISELPGIDIPSAMKRLSGNAKLLSNLIRKFGQTYANAAQDINAAIGVGDFQTAARVVHTVKGVAGNISATALYEVSVQLEEAVRNGRLELIAKTSEDFKKALLMIVELSQRLTSEEDEMPNIQPDPPSVIPSEDVTPLMLKLDSLLKDNDMDADEFFDSVKPHLAGRVPEQQLRALEEQIDALEFDHARESLHKIAAMLDLSLSEDM